MFLLEVWQTLQAIKEDQSLCLSLTNPVSPIKRSMKRFMGLDGGNILVNSSDLIPLASLNANLLKSLAAALFWYLYYYL